MPLHDERLDDVAGRDAQDLGRLLERAGVGALDELDLDAPRGSIRRDPVAPAHHDQNSCSTPCSVSQRFSP